MDDYGSSKGNNKVFLTFIVLVLFIVVGAFIVMNKDLITGKKVQETDPNNTVEKDTNKLTDELKNQIKNKLAILMFDFDSKYSDGKHGGYGFHTELFKRDLTDIDKQSYILKSTEFQPLTLDYKSISEIDKMISLDPNSKSDFKQIPAKVIDENYNKLFGEAITTRTNEFGNCPPIHYYADIETYVSFPARCTGLTDEFYLTYIDSMIKESEFIEVTMYLGYGKGDVVYSDFDLQTTDNTITPKEEVKVEEKDVSGNPTINKKNKDDFTKYKFIFKDNGEGEFFFVSIEQSK